MTATTIERLGREEEIKELARLLGGAQITEAVLKKCRRNEGSGRPDKKANDGKIKPD